MPLIISGSDSFLSSQGLQPRRVGHRQIELGGTIAQCTINTSIDYSHRSEGLSSILRFTYLRLLIVFRRLIRERRNLSGFEDRYMRSGQSSFNTPVSVKPPDCSKRIPILIKYHPDDRGIPNYHALLYPRDCIAELPPESPVVGAIPMCPKGSEKSHGRCCLS